MIYEKWSPELIAERLSKESENCVSHKSIYNWIWTAKHSNHKDLYKYLRNTGRRQRHKNLKDN